MRCCCCCLLLLLGRPGGLEEAAAEPKRRLQQENNLVEPLQKLAQYRLGHGGAQLCQLGGIGRVKAGSCSSGACRRTLAGDGQGRCRLQRALVLAKTACSWLNPAEYP